MIRSRPLLVALYVAAILIFVDQLSELVVGLMPYRASEASWRFGAFGLVGSRATALLFADAVFIAAILGLGHRRVLQTWGVLHWLAAGVMLAAIAVFGLDFLEVRQAVRDDAKRTFTFEALRVLAVTVLGAGYCIVVGWLTFRAARSDPRRDSGVAIVVGSEP